jgi:hypothetical protein
MTNKRSVRSISSRQLSEAAKLMAGTESAACLTHKNHHQQLLVVPVDASLKAWGGSPRLFSQIMVERRALKLPSSERTATGK